MVEFDETNVKEYEEMVRRPGKFEGENRYVPYFWNTDSGGDDIEGDEGYHVFVYNVNSEDKELFPELRGRKRIRLHERDDGFVVEVRR